MPFEETFSFINRVRQGMAATETSVKEALEARDLLNNDIANARKRLKRKLESPTYPNSLIEGIIKTLKSGNTMEAALIAEIENATQINTEFEDPEYKSRLYEAARDKNIYNFIKIGTGWSTRLVVQITFEEAAGTLSDWARGVLAYRAELKTKEGKAGSGLGLDATIWWRDHVYGTPLGDRTINRRVELSAKKAAFWQLLNSGTVSLTSDRQDESYNPIPAIPTDFIGSAEQRISASLLDGFDIERQKWFTEARELSFEIEQAVELRDVFSKEIEQLKADVESARHQSVLQRLGIRAEDVNKRKLAQAVRRLRAGEEFEKPIIQLGKKGRDISISVAELEGAIEL